MLHTKVFEWYKAFGEVREVIENLPHPIRPSSSDIDYNTEKVKDTVFENHCVGFREITEDINMFE